MRLLSAPQAKPTEQLRFPCRQPCTLSRATVETCENRARAHSLRSRARELHRRSLAMTRRLLPPLLRRMLAPCLLLLLHLRLLRVASADDDALAPLRNQLLWDDPTGADEFRQCGSVDTCPGFTRLRPRAGAKQQYLQPPGIHRSRAMPWLCANTVSQIVCVGWMFCLPDCLVSYLRLGLQEIGQWAVGGPSVFLWGFGLLPYKDTWITTSATPLNRRSPRPPYTIDTVSERAPLLHTIAAIVTGGPVAFGARRHCLFHRLCYTALVLHAQPETAAVLIAGDCVGGSFAANRPGSTVTSNAAMLHLLAREDGTLLKTDVPARAVDITWLNRVFNSSDTDAARAELWTGSTQVSGIEYGTIFASSHSTPISPSFRDLHLPDVDSMVWSFNNSRFPSPTPSPPPGPPAPCNRKPQPCPNEPGHTFCPSDPRAGQCQDKPVKNCPPCPPPPPAHESALPQVTSPYQPAEPAERRATLCEIASSAVQRSFSPSLSPSLSLSLSVLMLDTPDCVGGRPCHGARGYVASAEAAQGWREVDHSGGLQITGRPSANTQLRQL